MADDHGLTPGTETERLCGEIKALFPGEAAHPTQYRKRRFVFHQADPVEAVYYLDSGMVALERVDDDGNLTIFRVLGPGSLFAWSDLLGGGQHRNSAQTLVPSAVAAIPRKAFLATMRREPALAALLFHQAAMQLGEYEEHILRLCTLEVPDRLYSTLRSFADAGAAEEDGVLEVSVPLLKRDLAAYIGTSPEGISRGIRRLEEKAVAEFQGKHRVRLRRRAAE